MASTVVLAAVLGSIYCSALVAGVRTNSSLRSGILREAYTTNSICAKSKCINPIFPAMEDMHKLEKASWICANLYQTQGHLNFCKGAVSYDPALPIPAESGAASLSVAQLVQNQDNAASTAFFYHVTGLGLEAWEYRKPQFANDCVKSIWRMACFTYFPRAQAGCQAGSIVNYIRPCQSSCFNYIRQCGVECCDESVQCVFEHTRELPGNTQLTTRGYEPHDGPSSLCTGAAWRSTRPFGLVFWAMVILVLAMSMQGCDNQQLAAGFDPMAQHHVGNWRGQPDYLLKHQFVKPGDPASSAVLNSCAVGGLPPQMECSGHGACQLWNPAQLESAVSFCKCDRDWADPECRTRRKSQTVAYLLALFFGGFGADQFYLGIMGRGFLKLFTFGGFGFLWIADIVAIGSAPVKTPTFKTAHDMHHYVFVLTAVMFAMIFGFCISWVVTMFFRFDRRKQAMQFQMDEEERQWKAKDVIHNNGAAFGYGKQSMMGMGPMMPTMGMMPPYGTMGPVGSMPPAAMAGSMMPPAMPGSMMNPYGSVAMY